LRGPRIPRRRSGTRTGSAVIALHAQHATGAGVGIEPQYTAIGCKPFQAIMGLPIGTETRTLHVGKRARALPANAVEDLIERADFA
jgi:uncharacterized membrane protein